MALTIRLAVRDWDYLTPLALGDVRSADIDLTLDRVGTLPDDLAHDPRYEAGEMSFSRYALARAADDRSIVGLPQFLMRGFRHRCIVTAERTGLTEIAQLKGKRIGLTGWQDSGNTWTRAVLRRAGIGVEDATWFAGRLTAAHPITERLGGFGRPGRIEAAPGERPLMELLGAGELDAVFTPFMPPGFFDAGSGFRQLVPDFVAAERQYVRAVGYVPGMHVLGIKPDIVAGHPWLPKALCDLLDQSARVWLERRTKYADTTPWLLDEIRRMAQDLPAGWDRNGLAANRPMITDFGIELQAQGITARALTPEDLFPEPLLP
jgi:4,5-dihydroxyphthalate decarboxylase